MSRQIACVLHPMLWLFTSLLGMVETWLATGKKSPQSWSFYRKSYFLCTHPLKNWYLHYLWQSNGLGFLFSRWSRAVEFSILIKIQRFWNCTCVQLRLPVCFCRVHPAATPLPLGTKGKWEGMWGRSCFEDHQVHSLLPRHLAEPRLIHGEAWAPRSLWEAALVKPRYGKAEGGSVVGYRLSAPCHMVRKTLGRKGKEGVSFQADFSLNRFIPGEYFGEPFPSGKM